MKKRTYTKRAFLCLLFPLLCSVASFFIGGLCAIMAFILENDEMLSWIYMPFAIIAAFLVFFMPLIYLVCVIVSVVCQIKALRSGETKWKNYVMMAVSIPYFIVAARSLILFVQDMFQLFCRG